MCLAVRISAIAGGGELPAPAAVRAAAGLPVYREQARVPTLRVLAFDGDCGCGLLKNRQDVSSEIWTFSPELLPALEAAVTFVANQMKRFAFTNVYFGDDVRTEVVVKVTELRKTIRENQVRNGFRYLVTR